ncbi:MAG: bifunctional adenosylcobinamide kinase/adenosylcobinamide-phosphate guanylyltransferase [Gaiellaceae bacterium]
MSLTFLVGGARSGKSTLAVELATRAGGAVTFIATGEARDDEMAERIELHRAERPVEWQTVEEPVDLAAALAAAGDVAVVDCLSLWVANLLERDDDVTAANAAALHSAHGRRRTIVVSNEVGLGVVPATELGRRYRDTLGRVNADWAAAADEALLVVAGRTLELR